MDKTGINLTVRLVRIRFAGLRGEAAMPLDPFLKHGAFGPEATAAMGEAFEAACKELHDADKTEPVRKLIARRIIAAARRGELDAVRLRTAALGRMIVTHMSSAVSR